MLTTIFSYLIFLTILYCGQSKKENVATKVYQYGEQHPNDTLAFAGHGVVPKYVPTFHYKVSKPDEPLAQPYSCVRVEYINQVSKIRIHYEPANNSVSFSVKLPFANTPFFVVAYFAGPREADPEALSNATENNAPIARCQSCVLDYL